MLLFPIITVLVVSSLKGSNATPSTRIIGGTQAPEGSVPYQVSLRDSELKLRCGGSILNSRWILTASHCIRRQDTPKTIKIVTGTNSLSTGGDVYEVNKIVTYATNDSFKPDIALLQVDEIQFNDKVKPIALPEEDTKSGANVMVTGWGTNDVKNMKPVDRLQMLNATTLSFEECKKRKVNARETEICTAINSGKGICFGDAGNPLVEGNVVVGVATHAVFGCTNVYPTGFTRIFYYKDWILKNIT